MKKFNKNNRRGSINQIDAIPDTQVARLQKSFGEKYPSIDFITNQELSPDDFPITNKMEIGSLVIGPMEVELTKGEAVKIIETLESAIKTTYMRYRLGTLQG